MGDRKKVQVSRIVTVLPSQNSCSWIEKVYSQTVAWRTSFSLSSAKYRIMKNRRRAQDLPIKEISHGA